MTPKFFWLLVVALYGVALGALMTFGALGAVVFLLVLLTVVFMLERWFR